MSYARHSSSDLHGGDKNDEAGTDDPPSAVLAQPFAGWNHQRMTESIDKFISVSGLSDYERYIRRGGFLAQSKAAFPRHGEREDGLKLDDTERCFLDLEDSPRRIDKFNQPWKLYVLVALCSIGAAVQGWDETAVNGAQIYFQYTFGIAGKGHDNRNDWRRGLVISAPYLCCAFSCWLNYPLNRLLNRRGVIFLTCLISSFTCLGQAFPQTWKQLFLARFLLGFGIGPKSATIPIYAAECVPANIRGALVMMWQMWTAFGIMLGYIAGVVFAGVLNGGDSKICGPSVLPHGTTPINGWQGLYPNDGLVLPRGYSLAKNDTLQLPIDASILRSTACSLNWRLMLASPMVLPLIVVAYVYTLPESPRWLLMKARKGDKKKYEEAFMALCQLRHTKLQAARDLFLIDHLLAGEERILKQNNPFMELFTVGRNRRALVASVICMFLQQFCGVNVTAYYSNDILIHQGLSNKRALLISMGWGVINFVFALPAVWTIDSFGRRNLLLFTFPFMAIFHIFVVIGATLDQSVGKTVLVVLGIYLFGIAYSPGEGPVPFVYSAESMPLYNRDYGMGIVTSINWFWNWFIAFTLPGFISVYTAAGTFGWYAAWCVIGWWMILLFVPETKDLTLEQLDMVFERPTKAFMAHGMNQLRWWMKTYVLGRKRLERPVFLHVQEADVPVRPEMGDEVLELDERDGMNWDHGT